MSCNKKNKISKKPFVGLTLFLLMLLCFICFFSCIKDEPRLMKVLNDRIDVSFDTATIYFTVVDIGEGIDQYGQCWSKENNPTLEKCENSNALVPSMIKPGPLFNTITNLNSNTKYFIKTYLMKEGKVVYSNTLDFTTLTPTQPVVSTAAVTSVTSRGCICGGTVSSQGGASVTERGVCWSTSPEPSLSDNHTHDGSGPGSFISLMTNLEQLTTYYVKAYATNAIGTAYGSEVDFTTDFECGTQFLDERNGESYATVKIGSQCWMAENLNLGTRIDVLADQTDNSTIEKYCYDDLESNCDTFGGIYQWNEMMQYTTAESTQGICPDGWHLPSDNEWKVMEMAIGMSSAAADSTAWRGTTEGGKLKADTLFWDSPNIGATNSSSFSALPAGWVNNKVFVDKGINIIIWTSSTNDKFSWYRGLMSDHSDIYRFYGLRPSGISVRCIRDSE